MNKPAKKSKKIEHKAFARRLKELAVTATADDRKAFMETHGGSKPTVSRYLNGYVTNLDYAANMIAFLTEAHKKRTKLLSK